MNKRTNALEYPSSDHYDLPKRNVLVLSCMDLRLMDNLLDFLHFDNLQNRYDHFILAGASLFCTEQHQSLFKTGCCDKYGHWKDTMHEHLLLAKALHEVDDLYIVEHQDCGAYNEFLDKEKVDLTRVEEEKKCHRNFAETFAKEVNQHPELKLNVHCFFLDLRGNVDLLYTTTR